MQTKKESTLNKASKKVRVELINQIGCNFRFKSKVYEENH